MTKNERPAVPGRKRAAVLLRCWILTLLIPSGLGEAAQVTLAWDPSSNSELSGYRVRRGPRSGQYDTVFDVGREVTFTDRSVVSGKTYFYAVSAISVTGTESRLSKELKLDANNNRRPSISWIADRSVEGGRRISGIDFTISDPETPASNLTVSATSSRPDLIPPSLIQITGTGADRTATIRTIGLEPAVVTVGVVVSDGDLTARTQFLVTILPAQNRELEAVNRSLTVSEDSSAAVRLLAAGPHAQSVSFQVMALPQMGQLSGVPPNLTYTPSPDYSGSDAFTYVVQDGEFTSPPATVSIEVQPVNDAPVAVGDRMIVLPSGEATELTNGNSSVLGNDFDADDDTLEAVLVDGPSHGVLALSSDGTFVYQHGGSDETSDRFTYFVRDGQTKSEATEVKISVFRVKSRVTVEDALVLEWPGQQGNVYQVESRPKDTTTADAPVIVATLTADEDKTMATLIPPDGLSDRSLSVRCVYADSELTADVAIAGAN